MSRFNCDSLSILILNVSCLPADNTPPIYETVCLGESYNKHGFTLPPQDSTGSHTHYIELTDIYGCDSTVTLHLTVKPLHNDTLYARIHTNEPYSANGFSIQPQSNSGFYTFESKLYDRYGCDSVITLSLTVYAEIIPERYFSPNGDGVNDVWNIKNLEFFEVVSVEIFDRSGKLLVSQTGEYTPWDGIYSGVAMPSTDYWYVITIKDVDETRNLIGHFTLLR